MVMRLTSFFLLLILNFSANSALAETNYGYLFQWDIKPKSALIFYSGRNAGENYFFLGEVAGQGKNIVCSPSYSEELKMFAANCGFVLQRNGRFLSIEHRGILSSVIQNGGGDLVRNLDSHSDLRLVRMGNLTMNRDSNLDRDGDGQYDSNDIDRLNGDGTRKEVMKGALAERLYNFMKSGQMKIGLFPTAFKSNPNALVTRVVGENMICRAKRTKAKSKDIRYECEFSFDSQGASLSNHTR